MTEHKFAATLSSVRYRILLLIWLVTDLLIFVGAYAAAYFLRIGFFFSSDFPFDQHMTAASIAAPLWLLVLATTRTFHLTRNQKTLRNGAYIFYAALVGVALFTLIYYFTFNEFFSRLLLVNALVISSAGIWIWHIIFEYIERIVLRINPPMFPTLIVGVTRESKELIHALNRNRNPLKPVAILDGHGVKEQEIDRVPVIGKLNKLEETLTRFNITHLIQASELEQSLNLLSACRQRGIHYVVLPSVLGIVERDERVESLEGLPVTIVGPKKNRWSWFFR